MKEVTRLFDLLDLYRDQYSQHDTVFSTIHEGTWRSWPAVEYLSIVNKLSLGLIALGVQPGTRIATVMVNSPEWNFFDMAIMQTGAVQVPVYPTISEDNYKYILNDSGAEYLIISDINIYQRLKKVIKEMSGLKAIFSIDKINRVRNWTELLKLGEHHRDLQELERRKMSVGENDMVTIIYTSGTTGRPKGVMLSHRNFISNFKALSKIPPLEEGDRAISFLPLCHVYERTAGYCYQFLGLSIFYIQNIEELAESVREVKPHVFVAVPRVLEKAYANMMTRGRNQPFFKRIIFQWAARQGHKFEVDHVRGWFYDLKLELARMIVLNKWKNALGGNLKLIVCGSASLHPRLSRIFWAAGMPVLEAYGLTETSPGVSMQHFGVKGVKFGTVGELLEGVEVRFAPDHEILVKGPGVMIGYYNRPDRTAEAIDSEGWFHTGDIGEFIENRYLRITDRKKEMFKTSSGKYIAPQVIEQRFKESPFIEHIMVTGENMKCTGALIVPDFQHLKAWCEVKHIHFISPAKAIENPAIIRRFEREVNFYNTDLGQTEKIKKFILLADEWSSATGEYSPTLKMRRKFILEKYHDRIAELYCDEQFDFRKLKISEGS